MTARPKLQHQLSNGLWTDTPQERVGEFLDRCVRFNETIADHNEAIEAMSRGQKLRNDSADWYSNSRMASDDITPPTLSAAAQDRQQQLESSDY